MIEIFTVWGHCYSLKNHRPIHRTKGGRPFLGKSSALRAYQEKAILIMRAQWRSRPPLTGPCKIYITVYYAGPRPDALGPAETIFDCLQAAGVVEDDVQLIPQHILRFHGKKIEERFVAKLVPITDEREMVSYGS